MAWKPLSQFADERVGKLDNLRRARAARLSVPPTVWIAAADAAEEPPDPPDGMGGGALIVRSASPLEDTEEMTAAGRFESVVVERPDTDSFRTAVSRVVASLRTAGAEPAGAVFVQPLLLPERGGVAFTDGFYWERTTAPGGSLELTAGRERGAVERGHLERDDPWSRFVEQVARTFGRSLPRGSCLDLEFAVDGSDYTLLQVRPARFGRPNVHQHGRRERAGLGAAPQLVDVTPAERSPEVPQEDNEGRTFGVELIAEVRAAQPAAADGCIENVGGQAVGHRTSFRTS